MRVLVTGSSGLIGSHLAARLVETGCEVVGVDLVEPRIKPTYQVLQRDLGQACHFDFVAPDYPGFDAIVHLAARLGPAAVVADPFAVLEEHFCHALEIVEVAKRWRAALLIASSSEVYQASPGPLLSEDDCLLLGPSKYPRCAYAVAKLAVEHLAFAAARKHQLDIVIPRFFNVVGRGQREGFVLGAFAKAALSGQPLMVHGDGRQTRGFTHVEDCVNACVQLLNRPRPWAPLAVNIARPGAGTPIHRLAEAVAHHVRKNYAVPEVLIRRCDWSETRDEAWSLMQHRNASVTRLRALTGVVIPNRLDQIIADVCSDWSERLGVPRIGGMAA